MDEIDLVRRYRQHLRSQPGDEEQQQARGRLTAALAEERESSHRSRPKILARGSRRGLAVAAGLLALPAGYAIADVTNVFDQGRVPGHATPLTRDECERNPQLNSTPTASQIGRPRISCSDIPSELPAGAQPAPAVVFDPDVTHNAP